MNLLNFFLFFFFFFFEKVIKKFINYFFLPSFFLIIIINKKLSEIKHYFNNTNIGIFIHYDNKKYFLNLNHKHFKEKIKFIQLL